MRYYLTEKEGKRLVNDLRNIQKNDKIVFFLQGMNGKDVINHLTRFNRNIGLILNDRKNLIMVTGNRKIMFETEKWCKIHGYYLLSYELKNKNILEEQREQREQRVENDR